MMTQTLNERKKSFKLPKGETAVTSFDIGKKPNTHDVHITQKGPNFIVYVGNEKLDTYNSEKAAVKAAKDFGKLI
jgi:hypothetical protein